MSAGEADVMKSSSLSARSNWLWAGWSGVTSGLVGIAGVVLLALFYVIQVPHLRPSTGGWGSDPGASLGDANDVSGIVFELLLVPLIVLLWQLGAARGRAATAVMALGAGSASIGAVAGTGMVTRVLAESIASGITGGAAVLIAIWIGLWSRSARRDGWVSPRVRSAGQLIAVAIMVSAALVGLTFLIPRTFVGWAFTAVAAVPGVLAYVALPVWICWVSLCVIRLGLNTEAVSV
jgi:hypothetical protein